MHHSFDDCALQGNGKLFFCCITIFDTDHVWSNGHLKCTNDTVG